MVLTGYDYLDPELEQDLIDKGLDELIPIVQEVQKVKSEILDPLNKRLTELGYAHQLIVIPFVNER